MKVTKEMRSPKTSPRRAGRRTAPAAAPATVSALDAVINETTALFHRLKVVAEQIHHQGEMSGGRRGILRGLDAQGPQTVPQMARARPVSRQHVQMLVNALAAEGYVEFINNPAHQRSALVRLTPQGKDFVGAMNRQEARLLAGLEINIAEKDLRAAAAVLRQVRELFESEKWRRRLKTIK